MMSDGLTRPMIVASTKTDHGAARPLRNSAAGTPPQRDRWRAWPGAPCGCRRGRRPCRTGRDQGAEELQGAEDGQRQDRAGRDQHEPAQDHAFHLEGPGGQQVGRPLIAEARIWNGASAGTRAVRPTSFVRSLPWPASLGASQGGSPCAFGPRTAITALAWAFSPVAWLACYGPISCAILHTRNCRYPSTAVAL